jgi:A/G-specific adenine glycosylase
MIGAMKANSSSRRNLNPSRADAKPTLARRVLQWWDRHRRSLPWRAEAGQPADPYIVWLSEILLQQTNVATATPYFERFLALWPRIEDLAAASLEEVMQAFAGLGYYSRARNLHRCAGEIAQRGGVFPRTEAELRGLPGVGAYTAAAIAAIAFGEPASPVDGNIARIMTRLHAMEAPIAKARSDIAKAAAALTPSDRPGDFAQALMDIGAMICTPRNPDCAACPMRSACAAAATGEPGAYPRKETRKQRPQRAGAAFLALQSDGRLLLRTRPPHGLLGGTVELPGTPWAPDYAPDAAASGAPFAAPWRLTPGTVEQAFTHFSLRLNVYFVCLAGDAPAHDGGFWVAQKELKRIAFSSVMRKAVAHGLDFARGEQMADENGPLNRRRNGLATKRRSSP